MPVSFPISYYAILAVVVWSKTWVNVAKSILYVTHTNDVYPTQISIQSENDISKTETSFQGLLTH